jgi:hypothetical protein
MKNKIFVIIILLLCIINSYQAIHDIVNIEKLNSFHLEEYIILLDKVVNVSIKWGRIKAKRINKKEIIEAVDWNNYINENGNIYIYSYYISILLLI